MDEEEWSLGRSDGSSQGSFFEPDFPEDDLGEQFDSPDGVEVNLTSQRLERALASAVWAAYGDALGFISELTSQAGLVRRLGRGGIEAPYSLDRLIRDRPGDWPLQEVQAWPRRVGGQGGVTTRLPAGTYSDDTQLRLATSRTIRRGRLDVDVWARVELPAFTSYALGGGRATKAGASHMTKPGSTWPSGRTADWARAGGNGVVMRIAPLAYVNFAGMSDETSMLSDVLRNGVVTHGHPRALLPACLHAIALSDTLEAGGLAPFEYMHTWLDRLRSIPSLIEQDRDLSHVFRASWERATKESFDGVWKATVDEMHDQVEAFQAASGTNPAERYVTAAGQLGLLNSKTNGAGTSTFTAAYWLASEIKDAATALRLAVNVVGSDTDTIATMVGAHVGIVSDWRRLKVQDRNYIAAETLRLVAPDHPGGTKVMRYPDLLAWKAPRAQADYLGRDPYSSRPAVAGLGPGTFLGDPVRDARSDFAWQWIGMDYGQMLLMKRRAQLDELPDWALPMRHVDQSASKPTVGPSPELDELRERARRLSKEKSRKRGRAVAPQETLDLGPLRLTDAVRIAQREGLNPTTIGELLTRLASESPNDVVAAFALEVAALIHNREASSES